MLKDVIVALATFVTAAGGLELVKWLSTRKSAKRKARAEADTAAVETHATAFENLVRVNEFVSQQNEKLTEQIIKLQNDNQQLMKENARLGLDCQKYHCERAGCAERVPPNGY